MPVDAAHDATDVPEVPDIPPPIDTARPDDVTADTGDPDIADPDAGDADTTDAPDFGTGPCVPLREEGHQVCAESPAHCIAHAPQGTTCAEICESGDLACDYRVGSSSHCLADQQVEPCDGADANGVCLCRHCVRACDERECGDDGCGGSCGTCDGGTVCNAGVCERRPWLNVLSEVEGHAAEVTGGGEAGLCEVTNANDVGAGSLRACLGDGNVWIRFLGDYTINLSSPLLVPGNTTIDGRGQRVTITGATIEVRGEQNVILTNLVIDGVDYPDRHGVHVRNGSRLVWLDHLSVLRVGDNGIRVTDDSTDITISWCWFTQLTRGLNVGSGAESVNTRVTVHHNLFRNVDRYTPRVRWGRLHAYNNLIDNWSIIGAAVTERGQFLSQANIYSEHERVPAVTVDIFEDAERGFVRSENDAVFGETFVQTNNPEAVLDPDYAFTLDPTGDALISELHRRVGYQETDFPSE